MFYFSLGTVACFYYFTDVNSKVRVTMETSQDPFAIEIFCFANMMLWVRFATASY